MCPSAFRVSSPRPREEGAGVKPVPKPLPWTDGDVREKLYPDQCRGLDFH